MLHGIAGQQAPDSPQARGTGGNDGIVFADPGKFEQQVGISSRGFGRDQRQSDVLLGYTIIEAMPSAFNPRSYAISQLNLCSNTDQKMPATLSEIRPPIAAVSVIVRSMDRPALRRALLSVANQTVRPREVVVVAACGAQHKPIDLEIHGCEIRLVMETESGAPLLRNAAANLGLQHATSEWLAFLDDDDEWLPQHVARLLPFAANAFAKWGGSARLAYSLAQGINRAGQPADVYGRTFNRVRLWENTLMPPVSAMFHRSLVAEGCACDERFPILEDWDFWLQCAQRTHFMHLPEITCRWYGAEGESGCGFDENADGVLYRKYQSLIQDKWREPRERMLAELMDKPKRAAVLLANGDHAGAARLCESVLLDHPEDVNAANILGMIHLRQGDAQRAKALIEIAVRNSPPHAGLYRNMSLVEHALGNEPASAAWLQKMNDLSAPTGNARKNSS
jgi:Glycosyl transferase family 2/Tetratricopeptide repeat